MQPTLEGLPAGDAGQDVLDDAAAAHVLLNGTRHATRLDLLLSTIVEVLARGSQETDALVAAVRAAWPAADITRGDVLEALTVAQSGDQRLVHRADGLVGEVWHLDDAGRDEADVARQWVEGIRRRALVDMCRRAQRDFRPCSEAEAQLWVARLTAALDAGIRAGERAYVGAVEMGSPTALKPAAVDSSAIFRVIDRGADEDVAEFLRAAALAALDPTDPFGEEVVTTLSTSSLLHANLARLDVAQEQRRVGLLDGQSAVLDTPILVQLLSGQAVRGPLEQMVDAARDAGVNVLVLQHYLDELSGLVQARRTQASDLKDILDDPDQRSAFIALAGEDSMLVAYAQLRTEGVVSSWSDFEAYTTGLAERLRNRGVTVRPHGNSDYEQVERCRAALAQVITDTGGGRGAEAIGRDAHTLAMAMRHRRRFRRENKGTAWPGLFVVTHDRRLSPAYEALNPEACGVPLAVPPGTLTLLLARIRPVPEAAALTAAASRMMTRDIAERVTVRYPPSVAAQLARSLAGEGGATDVRVAQMPSVERAMEKATETADDILSEVLRRRAERMREATAHVGRLNDDERAAVDERRLAAEQERDRAHAAWDEARLTAEAEQKRVTQLEEQLAATLTVEQVARLRRRTGIRSGAIAINVAVAVWLSTQGEWFRAGFVLLAGMLLILQTSAWARDPDVRLRDAVVGITADTLSLLVAASAWVPSA
ncbi:hypothetical protein GB931_00270 [Modestobacter sp. I12A-02628]|uniref:Uncharacterized protein n=1 Tax=Goekera deserti TaxID=2497753 RepID=A0A7K3WID2_9ACTN|nr:hypothetical protein [Goekera deserti]MPQ96382.1 hypothetical protein [Goekera deserti]NEL56136.1 hypothetical protein [Goekera deserti]